MPSAAAAAAPRMRWMTPAGKARRRRGWAAAAVLLLATGYLRAGGGEHVPAGAEGFQALPGGAARAAVTREAVHRVPSVGELAGAARPSCLADQGFGGAPGDRDVGASGGHRRPVRRARPGTGGHGVLVGFEGVQGEAPPVGEDGAERRVPQREGSTFGGGCRGGWRAGRRRSVRPPAAAAGRAAGRA